MSQIRPGSAEMERRRSNGGILECHQFIWSKRCLSQLLIPCSLPEVGLPWRRSLCIAGVWGANVGFCHSLLLHAIYRPADVSDSVTTDFGTVSLLINPWYFSLPYNHLHFRGHSALVDLIIFAYRVSLIE